jgi:DNA replication protein DnaC
VEAPTADAFIATLHEARCPAELPTIEKRLGPGDSAIGIRVRDLFDTRRPRMRMPLDEVGTLFASPFVRGPDGWIPHLGLPGEGTAHRRRAQRDRQATTLRAHRAGLDPTMLLEAWDDTSPVGFDRALWSELCSLRFLADAHNALIMGPVGVGKTFLATALGHAAVRRRYSVHFERADKLFKRLRAARLDGTHDEELRKLHRVELLILDDLALHPLGPTDTSDFYELVVERHRAGSTITTSNRDPSEMITMMADPLLAQSAIDRLQSAAFELVVEDESYRQRQKPVVGRAAADESHEHS